MSDFPCPVGRIANTSLRFVNAQSALYCSVVSLSISENLCRKIPSRIVVNMFVHTIEDAILQLLQVIYVTYYANYSHK